MIKWGIIGAGNIAQRFATSLKNSKKGELYAIASHTESKREFFKQNYSDIIAYKKYEELLNDTNVDVVYIALRHKDHYEWAKKALLHHKAVLCEKPATLNVKEIEELKKISIREGVFFMEGIKTRFIPVINDLRKLIKDEVIGKILTIELKFCYDINDKENTRYLYDIKEGGILNDVGSYAIASIIDYIHTPLKEVRVKAEYSRHVDVHDIITLDFGDYQSAIFEIAMNQRKKPKMLINGTHGFITCNLFYRPETLNVKVNKKDTYSIYKPYINDDFYTEIEEVNTCLEEGMIESPLMTLDDSIQCAYILEKIREEMKNNEIQ